jgi:hypothetical protein
LASTTGVRDVSGGIGAGRVHSALGKKMEERDEKRKIRRKELKE